MTISASSQDKKQPIIPSEKFEDYKPCTDCFGDNWKTQTSTSTDNFQKPNVNLNINPAVNSVKSGLSRSAKIVLGLVGSIFLAAILTKATNQANAITTQ